MTGLSFLENINDIDCELLEASEKYSKKKIISIKWAAAAASLVLIAVLSIGIKVLGTQKSNTENGFTFKGVSYELAKASDIRSIDICSEAVRSNTCEVSKEDLGEKVGTLKIYIDDKSVSCDVYLLAHALEGKDIKVIAYPDGRYIAYKVKEE